MRNRSGLALFGMGIFLLLSTLAGDQELGYRRITMKERIREFYRTGGKAYRNKKVHIHIPAAVFRKKPKRIRRPGGVIWDVFENGAVPVLVNPENQYLKRLNNDFKKERKRGKKKIETLSVFGKVIQPSWDVKGRCHLEVHKIRTYGGALKKNGG